MKSAKSLGNFFYSFYGYILFIASLITHCILAQPAMLLAFLLGQDREFANIKIATFVIRFYAKLGGVTFETHGLENVPPTERFIIIANHQSYFDIAVLLVCLPRKFAFIAKKELLFMPIIGLDLLQQGHIFIDRQKARHAYRQLQDMQKEISEKNKNVLFFAEGTRSLSEEIAPFKKGAFVIAAATGTAILPCCLSGTGQILHKKNFGFRRGKARLHIGSLIPVPPCQPNEKVSKVAENLLQQTRAAILDLQKSSALRFNR